MRIGIGCFIVMAVLGFGAAADPGDDYSFKLWTVEDRLPDSPIMGIRQSPDGYIWAVTPTRLIRFNGVAFCDIPLPGTILETSGPLIGVACAADHSVWTYGAKGMARFFQGGWQAWSLAEAIADHQVQLGRLLGMEQRTDGSLCLYAERGLLEDLTPDGHFQIRSCPVPPDDRATLGAVTGASADRDGRIWMTAWNGLLEYSQGRFDDQSMRLPDFLVEAAHGVHAGRSGRLWVYGTTGVAYREGDIWTPIGFPENAGLATVLLEVSDGSLWMGNPTGLFRWERGWKRIAERDAPGSLSVNGLMEDQGGTLWAACDGGLLRIRRKRLATLPVGETATSGTAYSLFRDPGTDSTWVGYKGRGVRLKRADGRLLQTVYLDTDVPVSAITRDSQGRLWFGTLGGGLFVQHADAPALIPQRDYSLPTVHTVFALMDTPESGLLVGTPQGLMSVNARNELETATVYGTRVTDPVHTFLRDPDGTLWIGGERIGVLRIGTKGDKLQIGEEAGLSGYPRAILRDSKGHLWVGTTAGLFGISADTVVPLGLTDRVFSDAVLQMAEDAMGRLWLGTRNGLQCVPIDELELLMRGDAGQKSAGVRMMRWGPEDGLPGNRCMGGCLASTIRDDRLWFTFEKGVAVIVPSRAAFSRQPPTVAIERIEADGQEVWSNAAEPLREPAFSPDARNLVFTFAALSPGMPEEISYRYRVEGLRPGWSTVQGDRTVAFEWLPPGRYTLTVIAGAGGTWNLSGVSCPFTIKAHYWQTPWFYIGMIGGLAVIVFLIARAILWHRYKLQMEVLKREEALSVERARISRDIHDDLGNGLSVVATLSELAHNDVEKEAAHKRLDQIYDVANELARNVDEIVWAVNPANDGWEPFISYFEQYTEYFLGNSGLRFHFTRPEDLVERTIAAKTRHHLLLAVREAIGNVLKHASASQVSIAMRVSDDGLLTVTVADDGVGFDPQKRNGVGHDGLGNMARRMRETGGSVTIDAAPGKGTRVVFRVPLGPF
ncbi:MAG: ATP-binding protein [Kiritimatiellae bacterium]|nr:ATP-binding protein [Kiritimatiellia bacterium]